LDAVSRAGWAQHPLRGGLAPAWAVEWGEDRRGVFAAFAVGAPGAEVEQRMRWIPPGTFVMGSPEGELGRYDNEGPQHEVTLTHGYWLGETPVTQALWVAVMGTNPSAFQGDLQRPVEQVSWDDCQEFLVRLNAQVAGLVARLPTEAEWEQACRGGKREATWVGELSGEETAPELDSIAWYRGNSSGTQPVRGKAANPYGLYDMLGNVWEWCADAGLRAYTAEPVTNPVVGLGSYRVFRGGSWDGYARFVRAAHRGAGERGFRLDSLGFRLAGGQAALPPASEPRSGESHDRKNW
jgi:formylglycine-generating enzyme required for sulfatase activity